MQRGSLVFLCEATYYAYQILHFIAHFGFMVLSLEEAIPSIACHHRFSLRQWFNRTKDAVTKNASQHIHDDIVNICRPSCEILQCLNHHSYAKRS